MDGVFGVVEPATPDILKLGRMLRSLRRDRTEPMFLVDRKVKEVCCSNFRAYTVSSSSSYDDVRLRRLLRRKIFSSYIKDKMCAVRAAQLVQSVDSVFVEDSVEVIYCRQFEDLFVIKL